MDASLSKFLESLSTPTQTSSLLEGISETGLSTLSSAPLAIREAFFIQCGTVMEAAVSAELNKNDRKSAHTLMTLKEALDNLLEVNAESWSPIICNWCLEALGDVSSKYSNYITQSAFPQSMGVNEAMQKWLNFEPTRVLIDLTSICLNTLIQNSEATETCVGHLLDMSVKHSPHFDWVVASVGGRFPNTVIQRVLSVGLKDFCTSAELQVSKEGTFTLSKVSKLNSVIGILDHLAITHGKEIKNTLKTMINKSLEELFSNLPLSSPSKGKGKISSAYSLSSDSSKHIGCIPYFLYLASLSFSIRDILSDLVDCIISSPNVMIRISYLIEPWKKYFFTDKDDSLLTLVVHLFVNFKIRTIELMTLLIQTSAEKSDVPKEIRQACRQIIEYTIAELQMAVHQKSLRSETDLPLLMSLDQRALMEKFMFTVDVFQRRCILALLNLICLTKGRFAAVQVVQFCLTEADSEEELAILVEFIKDTELWIPDMVDFSVSHCLKSNQIRSSPFLRNLGLLLQYQSQAAEDSHKLKILSSFSKPIENNCLYLLSRMNEKAMIPDILKIFHFVPLQFSNLGDASVLFRSAHHFSHSFFIILKERGQVSTLKQFKEKTQLLASCLKNLNDVAKNTTGLPIVLRFLVEGAINSRLAIDLFGAKSATTIRESDAQNGPKIYNKNKNKSLLEENLKFGSMPTHPLGATTVFHAGVIGEGKRPVERTPPLDANSIDENRFTFVSALFKIIQNSGREKAKESAKQLSLLILELVCPDVMYNGLPWPEEDFAKVTIERDLKICKTFDDHPILWNILMGLAETRPALCYCSVLIRALMAVQMNWWQSSVAPKAKDNPKQLQTTKKILELMSVGQFLPHPFNALSDVIQVFHSFHLYCVLEDVWKYMKDNVPSPMAFACNSEGYLIREFEPFKNYKNYCERLRLIMIYHMDELPMEFKRFFVDVALKHEEDMKLAMEY